MRGTASTPTAMRWQSSRTLLIAAALGACVTRTQTFYLPPPAAHRISEDELREHANEALHIECPRLLGDRTSASGETHLTLGVDRNGDVARARLDHSSGDTRLDDIFGGLAATLRLQPSTHAQHRSEGAGLAISYSCSPGAVAVVVTRKR